MICDAVTGGRLGNIALVHDGRAGEVSYWVAAGARGRGVAARALVPFNSWCFQSVGLEELWLAAHRESHPGPGEPAIGHGPRSVRNNIRSVELDSEYYGMERQALVRVNVRQALSKSLLMLFWLIVSAGFRCWLVLRQQPGHVSQQWGQAISRRHYRHRKRPRDG